MEEPRTRSTADPQMVDVLTGAMMLALEEAAIPEITSQADVLSAVFTLLDRLLRVAKETEHPEDHAYNVKEVNRVLTDLLIEFGYVVH